MSIREPASLRLVKGRGGELQDENTFEPGAQATPALLRSAAVYGPNASGKSNLIYALWTMQRLVVDSAKEGQKNEPLPVTPFLLDADSRTRPSEFEVMFVSEGIRYQYGFAATAERIVEEWLLAYPKGRPQRLIERQYDEKNQAYVWGGMTKLTGPKQTWQEATRANALFLSTAIQLNCEQLGPVFDWFSQVLYIVESNGLRFDHSMNLCEDPERRKQILDFLKAADLHIDDLQVREEAIDLESLPEDMPEALKKELRGRSIQKVHCMHKSDDGTVEHFDIEGESEGTRRLFAFSGPVLDALKHGYVVVIDELNNSLHPLTVEFLIRLFHAGETNAGNAQLVFSTHDTSVLKQTLFRRDQIWFCEKDRSRSMRLFPLTDFSPRKGGENLELGYMSGRYSALPHVGTLRLQ